MRQHISPGPIGLKVALDETTIGLEFLPVPGEAVVIIKIAAVLNINSRCRLGCYQL